jgi:hypothetical protein
MTSPQRFPIAQLSRYEAGSRFPRPAKPDSALMSWERAGLFDRIPAHVLVADIFCGPLNIAATVNRSETLFGSNEIVGSKSLGLLGSLMGWRIEAS